MLLACMLVPGMIIIQHSKHLEDGLYLVDKVLDNTNKVVLKSNQALVPFNRDFLENAPSNSAGLIANTADFVPLLLEGEPQLVPQTDAKKKLQLSFSRPAGEKLEQFTAANIMKEATMIVDGKALTVNKIRDTIHGGKMEITTSSGNECERIYLTLKNHNIEKRK